MPSAGQRLLCFLEDSERPEVSWHLQGCGFCVTVAVPSAGLFSLCHLIDCAHPATCSTAPTVL